MSKQLRDAIDRAFNEVNVQHKFVVKLSPIDSHENHYIGPVLISNCFVHDYL